MFRRFKDAEMGSGQMQCLNRILITKSMEDNPLTTRYGRYSFLSGSCETTRMCSARYISAARPQCGGANADTADSFKRLRAEESMSAARLYFLQRHSRVRMGGSEIFSVRALISDSGKQKLRLPVGSPILSHFGCFALLFSTRA